MPWKSCEHCIVNLYHCYHSAMCGIHADGVLPSLWVAVCMCTPMLCGRRSYLFSYVFVVSFLCSEEQVNWFSSKKSHWCIYFFFKVAKWLWWVLHGSRRKLSVHFCVKFIVYTVWRMSHVALYANTVCCGLFRSTWSMGLCPRSPVHIETRARPVRGPWSWSLRPSADWPESLFMRCPLELWWRAVSIVYKSWLYGWDVIMRHHNL